MASSCTQLFLRCRTVANTRQNFAQLSRGISRLSTKKNILNGSLVIRANHTSTWASQVWKQQMFRYSDFTAKHVAAEEKAAEDTEASSRADVVAEEKAAEDTEASSRADVVAYTRPLLPIREALLATESQMSSDLEEAAELSALEEICDEEAVTTTVPAAIPPSSTSLSVYVDHSETLTKLVQLGVDLWKVEKRPNVGSMLLRLDFNTDVAPRLLFLKALGVEDSRLGYILTQNPFILTENLENLQARVNYLKSKNFSPENIASMVSRAPYLLNYSVKRLDNRLGFYQQQLKLSASHTRDIVARLPRLLTLSLELIKENLKVCEIELGFKQNEIQHIVIVNPRVLTASKWKLTQLFDLVHNTMKIPHHLIAKFPQALNTRYLRVRERHMFLDYLGKAQYDPSLPNYIPLDRLVYFPDEIFCTELALATLEDFYLFQKTL